MFSLKDPARAPLFERLVDEQPKSPDEFQPLRTFSIKGVLASVRREVGRLLNTRCPSPAHFVDAQAPTVIDYGIPDFSTFYPQSYEDGQRLTRFIVKAVSAFEPRLQEVRATVEEVLDNQMALRVRIDAVLVVEFVKEVVSFPVVVRRD